jgi:hypothetical protein
MFIKTDPQVAISNPKNILTFNLFFSLSKRYRLVVTKIPLVFDNNFVISDEFFSLLIKKLKVNKEQIKQSNNTKKTNPKKTPFA